MSNRLTYTIAIFLLFLMFLMAFLSILDDSLTFDETAHIAAGYSYLTQKDMRLNPEHPPLIKDLAAFPLLFLNLNFPKDHPSWIQKDNSVWWQQFEFASQFLYHSGNNPDQILLCSRIPMILLLIFLGWFLFYWAKELFGNKAALITLFLFSFSPTFLAHGRLVTTDVGAALGVVLSIYFWLRFLKNPIKKNIILAGVIFGVSMLLKFSLILLIPFFAIITLFYAGLKMGKKYILKYLGLALLVGIVGIIFIIWPVYQYHVWNYPPERQVRGAEFLLSSFRNKLLANLIIWTADKPILRPLSQYALGLMLVMQRATGGHTTYFLGEISAAGWKNYFPIVYLIKEPLAFHILTLIAILYAAWSMNIRSSPPFATLGRSIKKPPQQKFGGGWQNTLLRIKGWIRNHFTQFAMLTFIGLYWITSLVSNLNIGVRHLLPVFPFTILLVAGATTNLLKAPFLKLKYILLGILLFWQTVSVLSIYPHFLAYFNEIVGGPDYGYIYTVDSNLDWGQDLRRLKKWVDENEIDKIYVDYFGGGDVKYYLEEKYAPWWGTKKAEEFPKGNYLAVSVSLLQGGRAKPAPDFDQPCDYYNWLNQYKIVAKIGYSIFIYYIDQ